MDNLGKILFDQLRVFGGDKNEDAEGWIQILEAALLEWFPLPQITVKKEPASDGPTKVGNDVEVVDVLLTQGHFLLICQKLKDMALTWFRMVWLAETQAKKMLLSALVLSFRKKFCDSNQKSVRLGAFYGRTQKPTESVLKYNDAVVALAMSCDIDQKSLLVKFVQGLRPEIAVELDIFNPKDMVDALRLAIAIEKRLAHVELVNVTATARQIRCHNCGGSGHKFKDCSKPKKKKDVCDKCKGSHPTDKCRVTCYNCKEAGHKKANCPLLDKLNCVVINMLCVGGSDPAMVSSAVPQLCLNCSKYHRNCCPCLVPVDTRLLSSEVTIGGVTLNSLLDTGATRSFLKLDALRCLESKSIDVKLTKTNVQAISFSGNRVPIMGSKSLDVVVGSKTCLVDFLVVEKSDYPMVLGMDSLRDFSLVPAVNAISAAPDPRLVVAPDVLEMSDGSYQVASAVGDVNYRLTSLVQNLRIHPIVHKSRLFPWKSRGFKFKEVEVAELDPGLPSSGLWSIQPPIDVPCDSEHVEFEDSGDSVEPEYVVQKILEHKKDTNGYQFLTMYVGDDVDSASWQKPSMFYDIDGAVNIAFKKYCNAVGLRIKSLGGK